MLVDWVSVYFCGGRTPQAPEERPRLRGLPVIAGCENTFFAVLHGAFLPRVPVRIRKRSPGRHGVLPSSLFFAKKVNQTGFAIVYVSERGQRA